MSTFICIFFLSNLVVTTLDGENFKAFPVGIKAL